MDSTTMRNITNHDGYVQACEDLLEHLIEKSPEEAHGYMHSKNQSFKKEVHSLYRLQIFEKVPKKPW